MRSPPFDMPARMAFFLAGHNGLPPQNLPIKNFIRLLDAQSGEELVKTAPPRNDLAQPFHWDLAKFAGRKGVIELVDGDGGGAYAWMAAGRFEPNVIELPGGDAALKASNIQVAVALAGPLKLKELSGELRAIWKSKKQPEAVRGAAAVALVTLDPSSPPGDFAAVLNDANETPALRERAADALAALESKAALPALLEAMKGVPDKLQTKIAQALSANAASAQELLAAVAAGKASARVLFDKTVKDRLSQLKLPEIENKIAALTKGLQPADKELQNLIDARVKAFGAAKASAEAGVKIFEKNCMACHQLDGKGTVIGPQLDGVGARGLERIAEDVLDPSRNVDIAFRVSLVKLINGSVFSGLKRREEGEQIIFADSKGVESSLAKKDIREIRETPMSLMPDGFGEAMTPVDFNHLMAFLLSKTVKR